MEIKRNWDLGGSEVHWEDCGVKLLFRAGAGAGAGAG
jgi:hypothetical protein